MKKIFAILLSAFVLFFVGPLGATRTGSALAADVVEGAFYATYEAGGAALATLEAKFPQIIGLADDVVMSSINKSIRSFMIYDWYSMVCSYALEDYEYSLGQFEFEEYSFTAEAYVALGDSDSYLTVMCAMAVDMGGAHPSHMQIPLMYSLSKGELVEPAELVNNADAFYELVNSAVLAIIEEKGMAEEFDYWENYADIVRGRSYEMAATSAGLLVFFNQYDIAPYASGVQEYLIDYAKLSGTGLAEKIWPNGADPGFTVDALSGAWKTADDSAVSATLLLYPGDAFRLYQYNADENVTYLIEGVRAVKGSAINVSQIQVGKLDADGVYTKLEEGAALSFTFSLKQGGEPALSLINEEGKAIVLYPFDPDAPEDM